MRISWCNVNARMGAKPVSLRIKSASVNGVLLKWLSAGVISVIGAHPAGVYSGIVIEQR